MTSDEFPICGTARRAGAGINAKTAFLRALRAQAREKFTVASELLAALLPDAWTVREIPFAAVEYVHASILFVVGDSAGSDWLRERSGGKVKDWAAELDERITKARRGTSDDLMWLARSFAQRGLAAHVLGDFRGAEGFYREAIAMLEGIWGADHLEVGTYLDDCATLLLCVGRAEEGEAMIARARAIVVSKGFSYNRE